DAERGLPSSLRSTFHVSYAACMRTHTRAPSPNNLPSRTATARDIMVIGLRYVKYRRDAAGKNEANLIDRSLQQGTMVWRHRINLDYDGHISRRGDRQLRALLYEAAAVLLTRVRKESALRQWGLMLWKRLGFKRAAAALARRMAVVLHAMWKSGTPFNPTLGAATP